METERAVARTGWMPTLGIGRVVFAGLLLGAGAFLLFALSQASHFGWGFQFLDAAIVFAVVAPVAMLIDTGFVVGRLVRRRPAAAADQGNQAGQMFGVYLVVMWALIGYYCLVVF